MNLTQRQLENKVKHFKKLVMTKNVVSWEKDENGFIVLKYADGRIFKCRGPIVEMAGLL